MSKIKRKQLGYVPHSSIDSVVGGQVHLTAQEYADLLDLIGAPITTPSAIYDGGSSNTPTYALVLMGGSASLVSGDVIDCGNATTLII